VLRFFYDIERCLATSRSTKIWAGTLEEFHMMCSAANLLDEPAAFGEQIGTLWRRWRVELGRKLFCCISVKADVLDQVGQLALLAPSLIAEIAPLVLFWKSHLPVWLMSGFMAASFAIMWWLTWTVVAVLDGSGNVMRRPSTTFD
jgi:hypothetical protein